LFNNKRWHFLRPFACLTNPAQGKVVKQDEKPGKAVKMKPKESGNDQVPGSLDKS
jgi:hypothetical protein